MFQDICTGLTNDRGSKEHWYPPGPVAAAMQDKQAHT